MGEALTSPFLIMKMKQLKVGAPMIHQIMSDIGCTMGCWTWADHCHEHDINCQNVVIMDRNGDSMLEIDEQGYAAGEGDLMNVDTDYSNLPHAQQGSSNSLSSATAESGDTIGSASDDSSGGFFSSLADSLGSLGESLGDSFSSISDSIGDSFGGDGGGCGGGGCGGGCGGG